MSDTPDKRAVLSALRKELQDELDRFTRRALDAAEGATHEDNKPEGDKDMRSTEASYIARGQAERVREIEASLARLAAMEIRSFAEGDGIAVSALVDLRLEGTKGGAGKTTYFIVPVAGGVKLSVGGVDVQTLATSSPLGKALLGVAAGDEPEVVTPQGMKTYEVLRVR